MPNNLTNIVLRRIRSRTEDSANSQGDNPSIPVMAAASPVSLREAQFADFDSVSELTRRLGQGADSLQNWKRLWRDNPALHAGRLARIGWVLESDGAIVGFLGSIPLQCVFGGAELAAAATCRLAVEPAHRSSTALLITSFFRQKDVDLFVNTTATVAAGKIVTALRAVPLPQPDFGRVLFWVLHPRRFTRTVLQKAGINPAWAALGSTAGAVALQADTFVRRRTPKADLRGHSVVEIGWNDLGPELEDFWADRAKNTSQLFSKRSAEIMRWHFQPHGSARIAVLFGCYQSGRLMGYVVVRHDAATQDGLQRSLIADLMASSESPAVIGSLLSAAYASAEKADSDVLELMGFPQNIRKIIALWKPYSRDYPASPYFFKARDRALQEKLASEAAWYATPFDGDATLWP